MTPDLSWDQFRLVKSIAEARSLAGAAERLGVNQSTVFRRLAALEAAVGARLFDRSRTGYEPTAAGEDMIALAATMAASIVEFERRVAGRDVKLTGELSVTVPMGVGLHFMPAIVAEFQAANPSVIVELILANEALDLSRRGADVAVRLTNDPPEALVGRRICTARSCVYRRRDFAARASAEAGELSAFIGFAESLGPASSRRWIEANVDPGRIVAKANSAHCMLELALKGLGAALLPCYLGDRSPELVRVGYPAPELDAGLWTLTHADLRRAARVRAFMDFVAAELIKHRRSFEGDDS